MRSEVASYDTKQIGSIQVATSLRRDGQEMGISTVHLFCHQMDLVFALQISRFNLF